MASVYVASKFENKEAVRAAHAALLDDGHVITHDWTQESWELADARGIPRDQYALSCANADYLGAATADVVLLLADYDVKALGSMKGGLIEAGIGLSHGALIFSVGPSLSIFDAMPAWQRFDTLEQARAALREFDGGDACRS